MKIIEGNILDVKDGFICHQVNCRGKMGAGIALQIRRRWPQVYDDYISAHRKGLLFLGNVTTTQVGQNLFVANLCGQDRYGRDKQYTNYEALAVCFNLLIAAQIPIKRQIYLPYKMGCVNAGGDWKIVADMIEHYLPNATVVKLKQGGYR